MLLQHKPKLTDTLLLCHSKKTHKSRANLKLKIGKVIIKHLNYIQGHEADVSVRHAGKEHVLALVEIGLREEPRR